ncbi:hypothetical protein BLD44_003135 [Mastigocladus laminosus UU774]|nr:hypothetical protein B4U84_21515 [Westiellopsis prolifica IICB1]TFI55548.1 hypothetical protein BLD44_003135 [Mastigocladus laminosus UU774]
MLLAQKEEAQKYLQQISQELDADIFVFDADMEHTEVNCLIKKVKEIRNYSQSKSNVALFLTTYGGDLNSAYRLARFLKKNYKKLILFIFWRCKSAGTLLSIASDEIVMSDSGELGPLDVQVMKDGDIATESGLNIQQSLKVISEQAPKMFDQVLSGIYFSDSGLRKIVPLKVLEDIAARITINLLAPISTQIQPARLGELEREISVARDYGTRLNKDRRKITEQLITDYPSHGFVIDYEEVRELFGDCVREPEETEINLQKLISEIAYENYELIGSLEKLLEETPVEDEVEIQNDSNDDINDSDNNRVQVNTEETVAA